MKSFNFKTRIVCFLLASLWFASCEKDDGPRDGSVTVEVRYPENYGEEYAGSVEVKALNSLNQEESIRTTSAAGIAEFEKLTPGNYTFSTGVSLNESEAEELTGIGDAIQLSALEMNVQVAAGNEVVVTLLLAGSPVGGLVIKEIYYTGSKTASGGNYFSDQFIEIYNNSTGIIYLDSLCIADVYGVSGLINSNNVPTEFQDDQDAVYVNSVWRIPGSGEDHPLAPGESIIIAQDGVDHTAEELNPLSPVDLSGADWETFNERADNRDADAPEVPNLERLYFTGGFDWLITVFGPGIVLFKANDFDKLERIPYPGYEDVLDPRIKIPADFVLDAFEALKDGNSGTFKRIPVALDAGFVYADDTYSSQSFRRKVAKTIQGREVLEDTNNSSEDFNKLDSPTPGSFE
ncbi:DUF4876 domain-containing protein [Membranihabitans maritimus]|uniref:DUF4876 domain-containing protein n=1 Tax=Membranihabitans maritimus TaxID=2904244 RepID=UPI001F20AEB9|nr:DUF4876 domain-containing protein [Membranihabitans maritimus]